MSENTVTLNEIRLAVRELSFDRFLIPAFAVKEMGEGYFIIIDKDYSPANPDLEEETEVDNTEPNDTEVEIEPVNEEEKVEAYLKGRLLIVRKDENGDIVETKVEIIFNDTPTLEDLMNKFIEEGIVVAYTPYFKGTQSVRTLITVKEKELTEDFTAFRRYFFSEDEIDDYIRWYYGKVLSIPNVELTDDIIGKLQRPSEKHMAIWVAYYVVDKRRVYEQANAALSSTFTDGSDYTGAADTSSGAGTQTTVTIGSVFNITENPSEGFFATDFNKVGSDQFWGDRFSFWYRLSLYLRDLLETQFGDFSLRKDNVIPGKLQLEDPLRFRQYFDSYPFVVSPLTRGILSRIP